MRFTKMHGLANDYIYIDCFIEQIPDAQKGRLARLLSDRHRGIGGDGVVYIRPSKKADCGMDMYNADGSYSAMCGNALRCVAKYFYEKQHPAQTAADSDHSAKMTVESAGKVYELELFMEAGLVHSVRVCMGAPELTASKIPVVSDHAWAVDEPIKIAGTQMKMTCVSIGNPHAVVVYPALDALDMETLGPLFEHHPRFPERTNVEFIEIIDRKTIRMRVWVRGSGETLACGSGSCAALVACVLGGLTEDEISVRQNGGELLIFWDRQAKKIYMTGEAVTVFSGEISQAAMEAIEYDALK